MVNFDTRGGCQIFCNFDVRVWMPQPYLPMKIIASYQILVDLTNVTENTVQYDPTQHTTHRDLINLMDHYFLTKFYTLETKNFHVFHLTRSRKPRFFIDFS